MRKLIASTMVSLDGVMQAPGGPQEDPTGGFAFGGWSFNYWGEAMGLDMKGLDGKGRELVLGRGKRLFEAGAKAAALRLVASQASDTGVVMSTYVPAGEVSPGSFVQEEPSAKELERRAKLARVAG